MATESQKHAHASLRQPHVCPRRTNHWPKLASLFHFARLAPACPCATPRQLPGTPPAARRQTNHLPANRLRFFESANRPAPSPVVPNGADADIGGDCAIIHTMSGTFPRLAAPVVALLSLVCAASASDLPRLSFNELTDNSELVVSGRITRSWADWDAGHKYIWTHYELAVTATHKGAAGRTVDIAEPGGQLDGIEMTISGATGYRVGENVLVFLSRMPNGYLRTAGFGLGKYIVDQNVRVHGTATAQSLDGMSVREVGQLVSARSRANGGGAQ